MEHFTHLVNIFHDLMCPCSQGTCMFLLGRLGLLKPRLHCGKSSSILIQRVGQMQPRVSLHVWNLRFHCSQASSPVIFKMQNSWIQFRRFEDGVFHATVKFSNLLETLQLVLKIYFLFCCQRKNSRSAVKSEPTTAVSSPEKRKPKRKPSKAKEEELGETFSCFP